MVSLLPWAPAPHGLELDIALLGEEGGVALQRYQPRSPDSSPRNWVSGSMLPCLSPCLCLFVSLYLLSICLVNYVVLLQLFIFDHYLFDCPSISLCFLSTRPRLYVSLGLPLVSPFFHIMPVCLLVTICPWASSLGVPCHSLCAQSCQLPMFALSLCYFLSSS